MGTLPAWYPDELALAGDEHLDPEYVPGYDRKSRTDPAEDLEHLRELGLNESHTLVDLGAGTGTFALAVAPSCRRVVAVDVSPQMLGAIDQKARDNGIKNLESVQSGFLSYQHVGDPADFVYSRNALHHLPDYWKMIALLRIAEMLKPGGVFRFHDLVYTFDPAEADGAIESWLSNAAARPEDGFTKSELAEHVRSEYSTFDWLLEPMLARAGFEIRDVVHRPSGTYSAYTCIRL